MHTKLDIARNWLPRYTGTEIAAFGDYILLTNFRGYVESFAKRHDVPVLGTDRPMQTATSGNLTIINYGIGSPNAALIMDLLVARMPKGVLFLGKCGGLKASTEIGRVVKVVGSVVDTGAPSRTTS